MIVSNVIQNQNTTNIHEPSLFITSTRRLCFWCVLCLSICLFVIVPDNSKNDGTDLSKNFMRVGPDQRKRLLHFGKDLDHNLETKKGPDI